MPNVMVALDLKNHHWERDAPLLIYKLKHAGCTHYKVHGKLSPMDLGATAKHLRTAVLPGKSAVVMIDIKKHDIESQIIEAVEEHVMMGFDLVTVHASVGKTILSEVVKEYGEHVVAVTVLTGMKDEDVFAVYGKTRAEKEVDFGKIAFDSGVTKGVVSSAPGIPAIQEYVKGVPFMAPGIRPEGYVSNDQVAIATPAQARAFGASVLIVGRPVIESKYPEQVFAEISRQSAAP